MLLALVSVTAQMVALAALTGVVLPAAKKPVNPVMASALMHGIACGQHSKACPPAPTTPVLAGDSKQVEQIKVPTGAAQCPNSGAGAACGQAAAASQAGIPTLPAGATACPADPGKPALAVPGACSDAPPDPVPGTPAGAPRLQPASPIVTLSAATRVLATGATVLLGARSNLSMTGTPWALEIFDMTGRALVGACTQSTVCSVAYTGGTGRRTFVAYVMAPGRTVPAGNAAASSNSVDVRWLGVAVAVGSPSVVAPGTAITFTASASDDVGKIGYRIELHDAASGRRLTFCTQGTSCSTSLVEPNAATRSVVAQLVPQSPATHATSVSLSPTSGSVSGTWLGIQLSATSIAAVAGGPVSLKAQANAELSHTPWSIYIQNEAGQPMGQPCNAGTCSASVTAGVHDNSRYRAVIGRVVTDSVTGGPVGSVQSGDGTATSHLDVAATSQLVRPSRLIWGVDSCKPLSGDPAGGTGLLPSVAWNLGMPDFWGRYLPNTANCPGLNWAEIGAAHAHHIGILPIYNDFDCSAVAGYSAGASYAQAAVQLAVADGIPGGTGIAIDIEPPGDACPGAGNVDTGFIQGWYDVIVHYHYVPVYYGNSTFGSPFAAAWCSTVATRPEIANSSFLWSFEPSLQGGQSRSTAPTFSPSQSGCAGYAIAWQYQLSAGSDPDVDTDEASSVFPFWWP